MRLICRLFGMTLCLAAGAEEISDYQSLIDAVKAKKVTSSLNFVESLSPEIKKSVIVVNQSQSGKKLTAPGYPRLIFNFTPKNPGEPMLAVIVDTYAESPYFNEIHVIEHKGLMDFSKATPEAILGANLEFKLHEGRLKDKIEFTQPDAPVMQKCINCHQARK